MTKARNLADFADNTNLNEFADTFALPIVDGTDGQVLKTNGTGTLAFADALMTEGGTVTGSLEVQGTTTIGDFVRTPTYSALALADNTSHEVYLGRVSIGTGRIQVASSGNSAYEGAWFDYTMRYGSEGTDTSHSGFKVGTLSRYLAEITSIHALFVDSYTADVYMIYTLASAGTSQHLYWSLEGFSKYSTAVTLSETPVIDTLTANNKAPILMELDSGVTKTVTVDGDLVVTGTYPVGYTDNDVDDHINLSVAQANQTLHWDGSDFSWVRHGASNDSVTSFGSYSEFVDWWSSASYTPSGGTVVTIEGVSWMFIPAGHVDYGTDPLSSLSGWMPVGEVYIEHAGGGTSETATANQNALDELFANYDEVNLGYGNYQLGAGYTIPGDRKRLVGQRQGRTLLYFYGSTCYGIKFAPSTLDGSSYGVGGSLEGLAIVGPGVTHTDGIGLEISMYNGFICQDVSVQGFRNGCRVSGGQFFTFRDFKVFAPTGSSVTDVSDTYLFAIMPFDGGVNGWKPTYNVNVSRYQFGGDSYKNVQDLILLGCSDGTRFSQGYLAFGRRSNMCVRPSGPGPAGNITATTFTDSYFDGVDPGSGNGVPYGVYFDNTTENGLTNYLMFGSGCFIGNNTVNSVYSRANHLRGLFFNGTNLSGSGDRNLDIEGTSGTSGTRISINGCQLRGGKGSRLGNVNVLSLDGNVVSATTVNPAIELTGTITNLLVDSNIAMENYVDFSTSATVTNQEWGNNIGDFGIHSSRVSPIVFTTYSDFVDWWSDSITAGYTPPAGAIVAVGDLSWMLIPVGHIAYGTDPISALPGWMPIGEAYPEHFGAAANGVTDDRSALAEWLVWGEGKHLRVTNGSTYRGVISSPSEKLVIREGTTISGAGTIELGNTSAIYMEFMSIQASDITISGVKFVGDILAGTSGFFVILGDNTTPPDNVTFENGSIDLQNYMVGSTGAHGVHGFSFTRSFSNHMWKNWTFTRCNYATIKVNTDTSTQDGVVYDGCLFKNNVRGNLTGFNSPSGTLRNVKVVNNTFIRDTEYFADIQDQTLMGGVVGAEGAVISNNTGYGYGRDVIHCEEMTGPVSVTGNSWVHLGGGEDGGITFRSNDVGGSVVSTENITISSNSGKVVGTAKVGSSGIWVVWDADGAVGGKNVSIVGNTITGYETGINIGDAKPIAVTGNIISGSAYGIAAVQPSQSIYGNNIADTTVALRHVRTGIWGRNMATNCGTIFEARQTESRVMCVGFDVNLTNIELTNGSINSPFDLLSIPREMNGWIDYVMRQSGTAQSHYSADISSTSSTLGTVSRRFRVSEGDVYISTTDANVIVDNSGSLSVTASNISGSDVTIDINVSFTGSLVT